MEFTSIPNYNEDKIIELYKRMLRIRKTEERLLELFSRGELFGTTHTSIGQEANAVAALSHIKDGDVVYSNHRCHGHYLAYGGPMKEFFAEVMGKKEGIVGGRGGSQHICYKNFYSNGIQGGIVGNAVGSALAQKMSNSDNITVVFLGDGTMGQGLVYESLNFASLWGLPVLFIIENNKYAQTTPIEMALSGSLLDRAKSFDINAHQIESNNVIELHEIFEERFSYVRENRKPFVQIIHTYRTVPHSKGDDFRNIEEIEMWKKKDPITLISPMIPSSRKQEIEIKVTTEVDESVNWARNLNYLKLEDLEIENVNNISFKEETIYFSDTESEQRMNGVQSINRALHQLLELNNKIFLIGEDILDPYGGAFKVSKGLSTKYPKQVLTTPISEAAIVALAIGAAKRGYYPIVEIMFGDFLSLTLDQLLNHASKYKWMYNNKVNVPLVIRTPMGGKRGYGPTHSQSIEKLFMGIPNLTVVAASCVFNPGELLIRSVVNNKNPILFIENKSLYTEEINIDMDGKFDLFDFRMTSKRFPTVHLSLNNFQSADIAIICYGGNVSIAMEAAKQLLIEEELYVDIIVPSLISPIPIDEIINFLGPTTKVVVIEESNEKFGWGAELLVQLNERISLEKFKRIGSLDCPIPSSKPVELEILPNVGRVIQAVKEIELYE